MVGSQVSVAGWRDRLSGQTPACVLLTGHAQMARGWGQCTWGTALMGWFFVVWSSSQEFQAGQHTEQTAVWTPLHIVFTETTFLWILITRLVALPGIRTPWVWQAGMATEEGGLLGTRLSRMTSVCGDWTGWEVKHEDCPRWMSSLSPWDHRRQITGTAEAAHRDARHVWRPSDLLCFQEQTTFVLKIKTVCKYLLYSVGWRNTSLILENIWRSRHQCFCCYVECLLYS